jgi:L-lactate dehydrogenase (cytochrome)
MISFAKVKALSASGRLALVVAGVAYDFTDFAEEHPGGAAYLRKNRGKVCTQEFEASHPVDIIERTLTEAQYLSMRLGEVDPDTISPADVAAAVESQPAGGAAPDGSKPSIDACINVFDFEAIAREVVPEQGWVYYSSGAGERGFFGFFWFLFFLHIKLSVDSECAALEPTDAIHPIPLHVPLSNQRT